MNSNKAINFFSIARSVISILDLSTMFIKKIESVMENTGKNLTSLFVLFLMMMSFFMTTIMCFSFAIFIFFIDFQFTFMSAALLISSLNLLGLIIFTYLTKLKKEKMFKIKL